MFNRLLGLLLIIRGLAPFLVLAVLVIAGLVIVNDLRVILEPPVQRIQEEIDDIRSAADSLRRMLAREVPP